MNETETIEFKERLNDKFEKKIVGFLNTTRGGTLYIGADDGGKPTWVNEFDSKENYGKAIKR